MIEIGVEDFENKYVSRAAYDDMRARAEEMLNKLKRNHAFIESSMAFGESSEFRRGYLCSIANAIYLLERCLRETK